MNLRKMFYKLSELFWSPFKVPGQPGYIVRVYSLTTYAKFSEKTSNSYTMIRMHMCAYQG